METYRGPTVKVKKPKVRFRKKDGRVFIVVNGRWIGMSIQWQNGIGFLLQSARTWSCFS